MMKYNKEATDENILGTIASDTFHRSVDVESIISFFADELQTINHLSLRDCSNYFSRIFAASNLFPEEKIRNEDGIYMLIIMVPIICLFEITNPVDKQRIINGDGISILKTQ